MQSQIITMQSFQKAYKQLAPRTRKIVDNKIQHLAQNPAHPSLQAHRLRQAKAESIWECYISITKRLLYQYKNNAIYLLDVGEHSIIERVHLRHFK